jgi:hypothetical protein
MKSLLILVLLVALGAAAFFTRPTEADFQTYYRQQADSKDAGLLDTLFNPSAPGNYLKQVTYKNYLLFATIEYKGQTQYTGVFSHWFKRAAAAPAK